jgi:MFS family permease
MRVFFILAAGQILSNLGSRLTDFGLGVFIFQQTGSETQFAVSILISALPSIVLSPLAGALVDRWDRRTVLLFCDTVLALRTVTLLLILTSGSLAVWQIYIMNAVASVFEGFHGVAWSASTVLLVPKRHLSRVTGFTRAFGSATGILAPALAGVLYVLIGLKGIVLIDLASWAFAVVPLLLVRIPSPVREKLKRGATGLLTDIAEGWKELRSMGGLLELLLMYSAIGFFGITTEVLRGPYVMVSSGTEKYGIMESVVSIGTLCGSVLLATFALRRRVMIIIFGSELVVCVAGILMGLVPGFWLLLVWVFLFNCAVSYCDGTIAFLWQLKVRPEFQGRVFALRDTLTMSLMPIGVLIFSPLAEFVFEPRLQPGGAWAASIGSITGTGTGRGIGFLFVVSSLICTVILGLGWMRRRIRRADVELPDFDSIRQRRERSDEE